MTKTFVKRFDPEVSYDDIRREARLQRRAAALGLSPPVVRCLHNAIVMEKIDEKCLAEKYGDTVDDIPDWIKEQILDILYALYNAGIEYIDVTSYNFIEQDGVVWVIDFGHAREISDEEIDPYLDELFAEWNISKWNPEFE